MLRILGTVLFLVQIVAASMTSAATLSVSPVSFEVPAPRSNAKLSLQNRGSDQLAVQIRVFRWEKKNGADNLVPTKDVVASPPVAKLKPGGRYTVRIVRVAKTPVETEESYRLLVDQLPTPGKQAGSHVSFLIRQSIPVFFTAGEYERPTLRWSAEIKRQELVLTAANPGERRVRLAKINVRSSTATFEAPGEGFAGYVLAGSVSKWTQPVPNGLAAGSKITITAQDEHGPIEATAIIGAAE
jgi:fimbrial chaperone protein